MYTRCQHPDPSVRKKKPMTSPGLPHSMLDPSASRAITREVRRFMRRATLTYMGVRGTSARSRPSAFFSHLPVPLLGLLSCRKGRACRAWIPRKSKVPCRLFSPICAKALRIALPRWTRGSSQSRSPSRGLRQFASSPVVLLSSPRIFVVPCHPRFQK